MPKSAPEPLPGPPLHPQPEPGPNPAATPAPGESLATQTIVTRRGLLGAALVAGLVGLVLGGRPRSAHAAAQELDTDPQRKRALLDQQLSRCRPQGDPLQALLAGNRRFAAVWRATRGDLDPGERMQRFAKLWEDSCQPDPAALAQGQKPWAAVLACADSRVAPEWLFDVGPGVLFDVRSAGNTAFNAGIASLEYAVAELAVPLILVLGHSGCGAVTAAMADKPLTPLLQELVDPIRASLRPGMDLTDAIQANARASAGDLTRRSSLLAEAVAARRLRIVPAFLDLTSGQVQQL